MKPHLRRCRAVPPGHNAGFAANMEDMLDAYRLPHDPTVPTACMDEQPVQPVGETGQTIPAAPGKPRRADYQYERNGTAETFMFTEPLNGRRYASVREQRTARDWAQEAGDLPENRCPDADYVRLICDNPNTHKTASFYEAFPPEEAGKLTNRLEIHYTPRHGSWLNIAEIELSVLTRQCLDRRIPDIETLRNETGAWEQTGNGQQKSVDRQFTAEDARIKLRRLHPKFNS